MGLSVQQALELGNARLDLSEHHIIDGERATLQAVALLNFQGLDITGLKIERGDVLLSTSIHNVNALGSAGVVFDSLGTEKLFTIDEDFLGPMQALDLDSLGADLSSKRVEVEGAFVPVSLATQLSHIQGVDLSNVLTRMTT